jgi:hypothetical protein
MKVDQQSLAYIENVVTTARLVGIDGIIIEKDRVRAVDEDSTVILLHTTNVPELPFGSIGLNRTDVFSSRYAIARSIDNFEMDVIVDGPEDARYARALTMKAKGTKIDYRCANPATIRAPKALNDAVKYRVRMHPEAVLHMQKGASAMESDELTMIGSKDSVSFEVSDINGDKLSFKFGDTVDNVQPDDTSDPKFANRYPIKLLQTLFKANPDGYFFVTSRGMLKVSVNGLDVYVLPRT